MRGEPEVLRRLEPRAAASQEEPRSFWRTVVIVAFVLAVTVLLPHAISLCLAAFAGVVLSAALTGAASAVQRRARWLGRYGSLIVVMLGALVIVSATVSYGVLVTAPRLSDELGTELAAAVGRTSAALARVGIAAPAGWLAHPEGLLAEAWQHRERLLGVFSSALGGLTGLVLAVFVGIYTAFNPEDYVEGVVRLFPRHRWEEQRALAKVLASTLRVWLLARGASAAIIGVASALLLWALDVPLAITTGVLAALLTFIPNLGPLLTAIPAGLLALTVSTQTAVLVLAIYAGIQVVESYLLTPNIERRAIAVPAAAVLFAQVLLGALYGLIGVALAAPLLAVGAVLVRRRRLVAAAEMDEPIPPLPLTPVAAE